MGMLIDVIGVGAMGKKGKFPHSALFPLAPLSTQLQVGKGGRARPSSRLRQSYTAKGLWHSKSDLGGETEKVS